MKKIAMLLVVLAVGLVAALPMMAQASNQSSRPYEYAQQVADGLYTDDITWGDGSVDTVDYAWCQGRGAHLGVRYRAFNCYVETEEDSPYWVRVLTGWDSNSVSFLYYDD
jgi:hypothetical protein